MFKWNLRKLQQKKWSQKMKITLGLKEILAAIDGTEIKKIYTLLNGVILTSFDIGKVVDYECLTNFSRFVQINKMAHMTVNLIHRIRWGNGVCWCHQHFQKFSGNEGCHVYKVSRR